MNEGPKFKYMVVNYVIDTTDESTITATQEAMQEDMNGWGEGQWEISSIEHLKDDDALRTYMVTYKESRYLPGTSSNTVELGVSIE
jgi:hypothetical protein